MKRTQSRTNLMQSVEFTSATLTRLDVRTGESSTLAVAHSEKLFHLQVARPRHHSNHPRRRLCARDNCDFEKLADFPIISPISSCV